MGDIILSVYEHVHELKDNIIPLRDWPLSFPSLRASAIIRSGTEYISHMQYNDPIQSKDIECI